MKFAVILFLFVGGVAQAGLDGKWVLASQRGCANGNMYEDPFFSRFVDLFEIEIAEGKLVETLRMTDKTQDGKKVDKSECNAKLTYRMILQKPSGSGAAGTMKQMILDLEKTESKCLHAGVRADIQDLRYIDFPDFFETYDFLPPEQNPCGSGAVITQWKRK